MSRRMEGCQNRATQKVAPVNNIMETLKKSRLRERTARAWFSAFYDIRPGNGADPFLKPRSPYGAKMPIERWCVRVPASSAGRSLRGAANEWAKVLNIKKLFAVTTVTT